MQADDTQDVCEAVGRRVDPILTLAQAYGAAGRSSRPPLQVRLKQTLATGNVLQVCADAPALQVWLLMHGGWPGGLTGAECARRVEELQAMAALVQVTLTLTHTRIRSHTLSQLSSRTRTCWQQAVELGRVGYCF
jgi:hypothetical protein